MGELSISELRSRTGLAPSAVRFYERKGLLRSTGRPGGRRRYAEDTVERIALIDLLKRGGFTLSEIAALVGPQGRAAPDWRARAAAKLRELEDRARQLEQAQAALRHVLDAETDRIEDCPVHQRILRAHAEALAAAAPTNGAVRSGRGTPASAR